MEEHIKSNKPAAERRNGSRENSLKRTQGEVRQIRSNELLKNEEADEEGTNSLTRHLEEIGDTNLLRLGIGEFIYKSRTSQEIEVMRLAKRNVNLVFTLIVTFKGIVGEDEGVLFEKEADQHHHGHSSNEGCETGFKDEASEDEEIHKL